MKVVGLLQKSVLTAVPNSLTGPLPVSFLRAEESLVSRNTPGTLLTSLYLKLKLMRKLDEHHCSLEDVRRLRQLTWGLNSEDRYPALRRLTGERAGHGHLLLQEMNVPLSKSAEAVFNCSVGGPGRFGFSKPGGQNLLWVAQ